MTDTTTTTDPATLDPTGLIDAYFEMWNETDPARRSQLVEQVWTSDGRHVDPLADASGHAALTELIAGVQAQFAGHRFDRNSGIDSHHDQLRYGWQLAGSDGSVVVTAVDVAEVADGRLRRVAAFFGELPEASSEVVS